MYFYLDSPPSHETLTQSEFSIAALRVDPYNSAKVMIALKELLGKERINMVVTPEFSFHPRSEEDRDKYTLYLKTLGGKYVVMDESGIMVKHAIANVALLAARYRCSIMLSSFMEKDIKLNPYDHRNYSNTMLHIDLNGEIIGKKRKYHPSEGSFFVSVGQKIVKVLPLICQDAWYERVKNPETGKIEIVVPEWIKRNAPYDALVHSMGQADLNFEKLESHVEGRFIEDENSLPESWYIDTFGFYYSAYLPYLRIGVPIISSDFGTAGVFRGDLIPLKTHRDGGSYVFAKVPLGS